MHQLTRARVTRWPLRVTRVVPVLVVACLALGAARTAGAQGPRRFLEAAAFGRWTEVTEAFADLGGAWLPQSRADLLTLLRAGLDT